MLDKRICEKSKSHKIPKSAYSTFCRFLRTNKYSLCGEVNFLLIIKRLLKTTI